MSKNIFLYNFFWSSYNSSSYIKLQNSINSNENFKEIIQSQSNAFTKYLYWVSLTEVTGHICVMLQKFQQVIVIMQL